jgi:phospholipid/cholesterol/gamma-HCH transport system substrate-binding protein
MEKSNKTLVGIFVAAGLLLFTLALFLIGDRRQLFSSSIELYAEFQDISGLETGAPVRVSGGQAGEILEIIVPPGPQAKFRVRFRVIDDYQSVLRADSVATILTDGLVGNKFLEVGAGSEQGEKVKDGDSIDSREPFDISDLMQEARDTVSKVSETIDDVKGNLDKTLEGTARVVDDTDKLIVSVSDDVQKAVSSSSKIATNVNHIVDRINRGEGTVGKLFTDDQLYHNLQETSGEIRKTAGNMRQTTDHVREMVEEVQSRKIIADLKQTTQNIKDVTERARQAVEDFQPKEGEGLTADVRQTLAYANETMTDFSENAEALKHNWFFRGFFKKRRFFDLGEISIADYKAGKQAPGWPVDRAWLPASRLFDVQPDGSEKLSKQGKKEIERAMAPLLDRARTQPIIIEGYSAEGSPADHFTRSHDRAQLVKKYLENTFFLRPNYLGIMQMGAVPSDEGNGRFWEGVAVVLFSNQPPDKQDRTAGN